MTDPGGIHVRLTIQLLLALVAIHTATATLHAARPDRPDHPNIVVILTDDQGWGDLSVTGNTNLSTPNIDQLAGQGATLDRFYVAPVCSPTRAAFLTGRYAPRGGVYSTSAGGERLALGETTIAEVFKSAGYATGCFGKWHNGSQWPYHPNARGFDTFYGMPSGHWAQYFDWWVEHNGKHVDFKGYLADALTDKAIEFMTEHRDQPFFCYVPYNIPHAPMQVPDRFFKRFDGKKLDMRNRDPQKENDDFTRAALAMCENIDWNVGRMISALDKLDLTKNTIIVYFSDNGPNSWRWNGDMRGRKGSTDEGGVRSPCFIRWPGRIASNTQIKHNAGAIDLLPTLADLAGVPVKTNKPLDGKSVAPLLLSGGKADWPDRMIYSTWGGRIAVRTDQFMLDHKGKLYDLHTDPGQRNDIAKKHPDVADKLREAAKQYRQNVVSKLVRKPAPFPVGYRQFPVTYLPARDGVEHGTIQRSNRYPNSSFFEHWTSTDDSITWDLDVHAAGEYEAIVHYTCRPQDVGCIITLAMGDARLDATIDEAFDPPLVGPADDRTKRPESYAKRFKPLSLGRFKLPAGQGTMTLSADKIAGDEAIDVGGITLRLITD